MDICKESKKVINRQRIEDIISDRIKYESSCEDDSSSEDEQEYQEEEQEH